MRLCDPWHVSADPHCTSSPPHQLPPERASSPSAIRNFHSEKKKKKKNNLSVTRDVLQHQLPLASEAGTSRPDRGEANVLPSVTGLLGTPAMLALQKRAYLEAIGGLAASFSSQATQGTKNKPNNVTRQSSRVECHAVYLAQNESPCH